MLGLLLLLLLLFAALFAAAVGLVLTVASTVGLVWLLFTGCYRIAAGRPGGWARLLTSLALMGVWTLVAYA